MWTNGNRSLYERKGLRYPSDLTDAEWAVIAPLIPPGRRGGRRRSVDLRGVDEGLLYVLENGVGAELVDGGVLAGKPLTFLGFQATREETGMPRRVIRLITAQATRASTFCPGRLRARKLRPIRVW